jgi:hypothetical protein
MPALKPDQGNLDFRERSPTFVCVVQESILDDAQGG